MIKELLMAHSEYLKDLCILVIRVGIGAIFVRHGFPKIIKGPEEWLWFGNQMSNLGIYFAPVFWGFMAVMSEFLGGIFLMIGLGTRVAAFSIACVMLVAVVMHINKGDTYGYISHPLALLVVFVGLMIAGGGKYSLDYSLFTR